jgi:two-component system LytT family response regulator
MIHAVIIDDEMSGVISLELLLGKFVKDVKVVATTTDAAKGITIINDYRPDIVFLDINMPGLNGFELLERLEYRNFSLIFSTAHEEYALKALKLDASDYLLKPIDLEELKKAVKKVKQRIDERLNLPDVLTRLKEIGEIRSLRIPLPTKNNIEYISPAQVLYIEADSNYSTVTLSNGVKESVNQSLKEYEKLLCRNGFGFMRIHNSFIVNLFYVTRYLREDGGYVVVQGHKTIPVSKNKKAEFLKKINLENEQAKD